MRKALAVFVCVFALTAWMAAQDKDKDRDKDKSQAVRITNGPVIESVSSNSVTVAWSTNTGGSSVVQYGTDPNNLSKTEQEPYHEGHGTHRVKISGLQPGTTYYYKIVSGHGQGTGTEAESQVSQFTTSGPGGAGQAAQSQAPSQGQASQPTMGQIMSGQAAGQSPSGTKVPLYRAVNASGGHLFTHEYSEIRNATQNLGYKQEGITGYIMANQQANTSPLYRLLGPNGDHFYTANQNERNQALSQGYKDEGVAGYVANSQLPGTEPLYRMVNQKGEHFYTTNPSEHQQDMQQGWRDEGIAGYVWQS